MYDENGFLVWDCTLDIYGRSKLKLGTKTNCPFRWQGQYEDVELEGLYYNRFRYYDSNSGLYISKDPIGLKGGFSLYSYVKDVNTYVDILGMSSFDPFEFGTITSFPKDLHFGQQRIAPNFSDIGSQADSSIRGRAISDVANDIAKNNIDPNIFLISYTIDPETGKSVTLNNRGLAALSEGGKMPTDAIFVPFDKVPERLKQDFG